MVDSNTKWFGVIGNPIEHSLSPLIHNSAFEKLKVNAAYLAFKVEDVKNAINAIKEFGISGYSVTIPHKVTIMQYLDEIDSLAKKVGAVNTVLVKNEKLIGYNTDVMGAINPLKEITPLKGKNVFVIGAGGAARAIVLGLVNEHAKVTIFNRDFSHAQKLAKEFSVSSKEIGVLSALAEDCDILINATPVGMYPKVNELPVDEGVIRKKMIVFDIVYNPLETKLIRVAKKKGCKVVPGVEMFLNQAYAQFEMFTGKKAPVEIMRKVVLKELKKRQKNQS
ncbi:MAG: shikimate dehydrogenase [archaeon]|jgi:shikimate dehydrogenase